MWAANSYRGSPILDGRYYRQVGEPTVGQTTIGEKTQCRNQLNQLTFLSAIVPYFLIFLTKFQRNVNILQKLSKTKIIIVFVYAYAFKISYIYIYGLFVLMFIQLVCVCIVYLHTQEKAQTTQEIYRTRRKFKYILRTTKDT